MTFFNSFTESIRQKWLQFFQLNRDWIKLHMEVESVYTPDGGRRPPSYLILGVVNALEPKLAQLMQPFSKLNPDADTLIEVLELHFDPDIALGNRVLPYSDESRFESHDETSTISQTNGNGMGTHELAVEDHEQTLMVSDTTMGDELSAMSLDEITEEELKKPSSISKDKHSDESHHMQNVDAVDAFGDISFDDLKEVDSKHSTTALDENGFGEALSDVWSDQKASHKDEAEHDIFSVSGEELSSDSFDEAEIARLFPKA